MAAYGNFVAVCNAIAALSVTGLTIKTLSGIPDSVEARDCPILFPSPENLITGLNVERVSYGSATQGRKDVNYTLTYKFIFARVGTGRGLYDVFPDMIAMIDLLFSTMVDSDDLSGTVEFIPSGNIVPTIITAPNGQSFHGCDLTFSILEFVR